MHNKKIYLLLTMAIGVFSGCISTDTGTLSESIREERLKKVELRNNANFNEAENRDGKNELPVISGDLSLEDAIKLSMANNLALKAAYISRDAVDGAILEAYSGFLPNVGLSAQAMSDIPSKNDSDSYSLGVNITQPLWRGGGISAALHYAKIYAYSTDASIRKKVQETIYETTLKYMDVLLAQHLVDVYDDAVKVAERMLQTTESKLKSGTSRSYDVLRAEVEVAKTKSDLIKEQNNLQTSKVALLQMLGVSQNSNVALSGELVYSPTEYNIEAESAKALIEKPDVLIAEANVRMAKEQINIVKSAYQPSADLFLNGAYENTSKSDDSWDDKWTVGAKLTFSLFDGFARRGRVIQATSKYNEAQAQLADVEERTHVNVVNSVLQLRYADELFNSQKKNVLIATEAMRMIEAGSNLGRNTPLEVLDARASLTEAMGAYYRAVYVHNAANLSVQNATGTLTPPQ